MYRLICASYCVKYGFTYALIDNNNNVITVWEKEELYELYQKYGISNAILKITKTGKLKFENFFISSFTRKYQFKDAWLHRYSCQSGELGKIVALEFAHELLKSERWNKK